MKPISWVKSKVNTIIQKMPTGIRKKSLISIAVTVAATKTPSNLSPNKLYLMRRYTWVNKDTHVTLGRYIRQKICFQLALEHMYHYLLALY